MAAKKESTAADSAKKLFLFNVSGVIGTALHYVVYNAMLTGMPASVESRTTVAWVVSYLMSIGACVRAEGARHR